MRDVNGSALREKARTHSWIPVEAEQNGLTLLALRSRYVPEDGMPVVHILDNTYTILQTNYLRGNTRWPGQE